MSGRIWALLLLALLLRFPFHGGTDLDIFIRWARLTQTHELSAVYQGTGINYPPVAVYLLATAGWIESHLPEAVRGGDRALIALIKLPALLADFVTGALIALAFRRGPGVRPAVIFALYVFNPAVWYLGAYWTQLDPLYTTLLVLSLALLSAGQVVPAWLACTLAVGLKLQSVAFVPVLLAATVREHGIRAAARAVAVSALAAAIIVMPWWADGQIGALVRACTTLTPRLNEGAYNFWYLIQLGDVHMVSSALRPYGVAASYGTIGSALFGGSMLLIAATVWRYGRRSLAAAASSTSLFLFLPAAHERFLFPSLAFVLLAAVRREHSAYVLRSVYALLSFNLLFNLMTITSFAPTLWTNLVAMQPPHSGLILTLKALALAVAAANILVFGLFVRALLQPNRAPTMTAVSGRTGLGG